jgi:HK97 gp10 family phage protein
MAKITVDVEVKNLIRVQRETIKKLENTVGSPAVQAMKDATLRVTADAKRNAPVDTGRLRASITPQVKSSSRIEEIIGIVGSNVIYAAFQELGTRYMKGRFYLKRAFESNRAWIIQRFNRFVSRTIK